MKTSDSLAIFQGYSTVSGKTYLQAVTAKTAQNGATSSTSFLVTTESEKIRRELNIENSFSANFWFDGSISSKLDYYNNLDLTDTSVIIMVHAKKIIHESFMTSGLNTLPGVSLPKNKEESNRFFNNYGDCFVKDISVGGEYFSSYVFDCQTQTEQNSLLASLSEAEILDGGEMNEHLQAALKTFTASSSITAKYTTHVTGIEDPKHPSQSEMISFASDFTSMKLDAPTVVNFDVDSYTKIIEKEFDTIEKNRKYFMGDTNNTGLITKASKIDRTLNKIKKILETYQFYLGNDVNLNTIDHNLCDVKNKATAELKAVSDQINVYIDNPNATFTAPELTTLEAGTPSLRTWFSHKQTEGGIGGNPFDDVNSANFIPNHTYISKIELRTGSRVDCLSVTYCNDSPKKEWSCKHGGNGGQPAGCLELKKEIRVNSISGRSGTRIDHLKFTANNNADLEGGGSGGTEFVISFPTDMFLIGFKGRSGDELDALTPVFGGFQPASWEKD